MTHNDRPRHSTIRRLAIVIGLIAVAGGLSQCRTTQDTVTGVSFRQGVGLNGGGGSTKCIRKCSEAYKAAVHVESVRHLQALKACGNNAGCKRDENRRHDTILDGLRGDRKQCKRNCYNEGGGGNHHD